ncbi:MAG TPA: UDP-N-acetylglucosamine 2-epimerase (non-hydrolyzing) [Xanthobacteraceae bacterium]|jgi:UDP-N-acetylglucosamine 2-epimerase (non-hydrolysing)
MNVQRPQRLRCACIVGTRPEVIKMAPVIRRLARTDWAAPVVVATGQQDGLLGQALADFAIVPDHAFAHEPKGGTVIPVLAAIAKALDAAFAQIRPALVVAQGDTTSVFAASLAAFYRDIPFVHVEAGLRTGELQAPFPEEFHRRAIAIAALLHCAPTEAAALHLREENIAADQILMSGNTVIDALIETAAARPAAPHGFPKVAKPILLTAHRRENFGEPLRAAFAAIRDFVDMTPDTAVYFPVHPNPAARAVAYRVLSGHPRIVLAEPASYGEIVGAIQRAWLVVTDSGGLQEEAPALGKPVLVLRDTTERPEAVAAGAVRVIGTRQDRVRDELLHLYRNPAAYAGMARPVFPYGDGHAAQRIVAALEHRMVGRAVMAATTQQHGGQTWTH